MQLSGRWRLPVQSMPASYNNHMGKWRGKLLRREGGIASFFQLLVEWHCRSVPQKHMGYSCALYNCWWGTCLWPLSWPFPPVIHCHRGTCPWNSLSNHIGSSCIQMAMPFIWGGGYKTSYSYWRVYSLKAKRGEVPHGAQRELPGGLLPGFQSSSVHQAEVFWSKSPYFQPRGISQLLWSLPGDGHMCWPSGLQNLQNPRGLDLAERPLVCQWCIEEVTEGSAIFSTPYPL